MGDRILEFIHDYHEEHHWAPSFREIMAAVGLKSTSTIMFHVHKLEFKGYVTMGKGSRMIALTKEGLARIGRQT